MVCIQCYLPPILFMVYMKLIHPYLSPFLEPALDKVIGWIWGPQAVQNGCPIRAGKSKRTNETATAGPSGGDQQEGKEKSIPSTSSKTKDD